MSESSSSQSFRFDIPLVVRFGEIIDNIGRVDPDAIGKQTGINSPKVKENINYLRFCNVIDDKGLTYFGAILLKLRDSYQFREPLLLYKLSRGCRNGGHYYFTRLINNVLYDIAFSVNNTRNNGEILSYCLSSEEENEYCNDNVSGKKKLFSQALNMGLSNPVTGFGKLGMVVENNGVYEISGYIPHKLVTAYILYDNWPEGRTALKITEIVHKEYLPGKIFFIGQDIIAQQLYELQADRLIFIEQEAGLDQVRLNPKLRSEDILDRMVEYAN